MHDMIIFTIGSMYFLAGSYPDPAAFNEEEAEESKQVEEAQQQAKSDDQDRVELQVGGLEIQVNLDVDKEVGVRPQSPKYG